MADGKKLLKKNFERYLNKIVDQTRRNSLLNLNRSKKLLLKYDLEGFLAFIDSSPALILTEQDYKEWKKYTDSEDKEEAEYEPPTLPYLDPEKLSGSKSNLISMIDDLRLSYKRDKSEYGVHSLFLTLGNVHWSDSRYEDREYEGPILLVSTQLERKRTNGYTWDFKIEKEDVVINPALKVILENQHGAPDLTIDQCIDEYEEKENEKTIDISFQYKAVVSKLQKIFKAKSDTDFKIENTLTFSKHRFQNYHIYEDLKKHQESIIESAFIQGILMSEEGAEEKFPLFSPQNEPEILAPENDYSVLDADSSQQRVISQVSQGQSLIVQGPPGTGKSQTIANLISNLVARGKKVLFVCDKKVALQVVEKRLTEAGLGKLLLPLYEGVDDKKNAAKEIVNTYSYLAKDKKFSDKNTQLITRRENILRELYVYKSFINSICENLDFVIKNKLYDLNYNQVLPLLEHFDLDVNGIDEEQFDALTQRFDESEDLYASSKHLYQKFGSKPLIKEVDEEFLNEMKNRYLDATENIEALDQIPKTLISKKTILETIDVINFTHENEDNLRTLNDLKLSGKIDDVISGANNLLVEVNKLTEIAKTPNWKILSEDKFSSLHNAFAGIKDLQDNLTLQQLSKHYTDLRIVSDIKDSTELENLSLDDFSLLANFGIHYKKHEHLVSFCKDRKDFQKLFIVAGQLAKTSKSLDKISETLLSQGVDINKVYIENKPQIDRLTELKIFLPFGKKYSLVRSAVASISFLSDKISFSKYKLILRYLKEYVMHLNNKQQLASSITEIDLDKLSTSQLASLKSSSEQLRYSLEHINREWSDIVSLAELIEPAWKKNPEIVDSMRTVSKSVSLYSSSPELNTDNIQTIIRFARKQEKNSFRFLSEATDVFSSSLSLTDVENWIDSQSKFHKISTKVFVIAKDIGGEYSLENIQTLIDGIQKYTQIETEDSINLEGISLNMVSKLLESDIMNLKKIFGEFSNIARQYISEPQNITSHSLIDEMQTALNDWGKYSDYCQFSEFQNWVREWRLSSILEEFIVGEMKSWGHLVESLVVLGWVDGQEFSGVPGSEVLEKVKSRYYSKLVTHFRELDIDCITENYQRILNDHSKRLQHQSIPTILKRESNKKRQLKPVNALVANAGSFMQDVKPVWLMNPSTISMHFSQSKPEFDCVIFDESSQLKLEHALSALSMAEQIVILGDEHQLPPTSFFETIDGDHEDETDDYQYEDLLAAGKTLLGVSHESMLNYHYRSKYEDLIAFSNHFVYQDRLITFPNPFDSKAVTLEYLSNSVCLEGRNDVEAQKVVEVCKSIVDDPEYSEKSLGVIALSKKQENAIREAFHSFISSNLEYEEIFGEELDGVQEPFFIKNLENVQGDERDIIVLSTAYGKDTKGNIHQRFGPINTGNGYRRLNVAITRAKEKMVCVTSLRPIDINEGTNRGRQMLKQFLNYCEFGKDSLHTEDVISEGPEESDFEISVREALRARGLCVDTQIGVSGYRIDLGIRDESRNRYILGIECDGAIYHKSYSARVNDRIRETHLTNLGWHIYRIWSYDWSEHRENVIEDILALVNKYHKELDKKTR